MGAIHNLLGRLGFVKLDRYGLLLTPDGRILSSRPAVLDDGLGGRIVGWLDGDLAAMELDKWEPARPAGKQATARRVAVAVAPTMPQPVRPPMPPAAKVVAPAAPVKAEPRLPGVPPVAAPAPAPVAAATVPAPVAPAEEPEDDDWEWTIAMARARAAADETEAAAAAPKFVAPAPAPAPARAPAPAPAPKPAFVPAKTAPMAAVAAPKKTEPMIAQPEPQEDWDALIAKAQAPRTIIPVPQLPRVSDPSMVRPAVVPAVAPLRRVPRSTNRIEDTVRTHAAPPANDDKTSPGIALPPSGGGRRVAAKQR